MYMEMSDGEKIYVDIIGEGKPIILVHGFSEDNNIYNRQKRVLKKKYQVITYDVRGHGKSSKNKNLHMERLGQDLAEIIGALNLESVNLLGWSMGASIVFQYLSVYGDDKVDKIIIVEKSPRDLDFKYGLFKGTYKKEDYLRDLEKMEENFYEFFHDFFIFMTQGKISEEIIEANYEKNDEDSLRQIWKSMVLEDYTELLGKINKEVLLIFGGKSSLYSLETAYYMEAEIKKSKLLIYENSGHILPLEEGPRFNRDIEDFIK